MKRARRNCRKVILASFATVAAVIGLAACGNRLPYQQVLKENSEIGAPVGNGSTGQSSSLGSTASSETTTTAVGGVGTAQTGGNSGVVGTTVPSIPGRQAASQQAGAQTANCTGAATGSTVNLGQIGSDTGLLGTLLGGGREGAQIWTNYINQHGGLNCHKVKLITADDGGDPSTALSEAQTMVQADHVIAFISNDGVLSTPTIAPYLQQEGVPTIGGTDVETQWYSNPDFYPHGAGIRVTVDGAIKDDIQAGYTKIGQITCVEFALICGNVSTLIEQDAPTLGGQEVYNASVSLAQPDYTSECLGAQSAGVTTLFLGLDPASIDRFVQDCANQNYHPHYIAISLVFAPALLNTPLTVGILATSPVFPFMVQAPATAQFDQAVQESTGGSPNSQFLASAWVAGLILQAASKNLPANPTAADVVAGLDTIKNDDFGGLTVPLSYTAGQPTASPTCYFSLEVTSGGFSAPDGLQTQCLPASFSPNQ
ncbi:MAG TPA: ABC transporter substrate-binding protein [Acidimicrobiales bacterium]|jgi:branched-chain amino acid transport system substrate-binding protein|nr:ABC transporter substrate-binding protein [Acidimicrobiales bacterium]